MHIFLTGNPGVGKTTLIKKICEHLKQKCIKATGFYTEELRTNGQRVGFDVVTLCGERSPLARVSSTVRGPMVGKYTVDVRSFESAVLPLLDMSECGSVLVIFRRALLNLELCGMQVSRFYKPLRDDAALVDHFSIRTGMPDWSDVTL